MTARTDMDTSSANVARRCAGVHRRDAARQKAEYPGWDRPTTAFRRFTRRAILAADARADLEMRIALMYEGKADNPDVIGDMPISCDGDHPAPECGPDCWWAHWTGPPREDPPQESLDNTNPNNERQV